MTRKDPIRTIVIAGGGVVGLSAASALARALAATEVTLIETFPDPSALADLLPTTSPGGSRFHSAIGVDEAELVRDGIAAHHLGTIFENWSRSAAQWVHAFGDYGKPAAGIPFDQIWCRARKESQALAYDRYSVGAALAIQDKFVRPATDPTSLGSRFQYGLRLDAEPYRQRLRTVAEAAGVKIRAADIRAVETGDSGIEKLLLGNGDEIEADLFIDCTGPSARLIGRVDESFEDWSEWMPFDRLTITTDRSAGAPGTADRVRASADGWAFERNINEKTIRAELRIGGEGIPVCRGRRARPWAGNVLALGEAAAAFDPLHSMNLHLAQQMILLALELLPGRGFSTAEADEYNRRAEQLTARLRDFLALHYLCSGRSGAIWTALEERQPPDSLARTLDQYRYRARLPFFEEEPLTRDSWTAALLGLGILPSHADPQSCLVPLDKVVSAMRQLAQEIEQAVARVPTYAAYLAGMRA